MNNVAKTGVAVFDPLNPDEVASAIINLSARVSELETRTREEIETLTSVSVAKTSDEGPDITIADMANALSDLTSDDGKYLHVSKNLYSAIVERSKQTFGNGVKSVVSFHGFLTVCRTDWEGLKWSVEANS